MHAQIRGRIHKLWGKHKCVERIVNINYNNKLGNTEKREFFEKTTRFARMCVLGRVLDLKTHGCV